MAQFIYRPRCMIHIHYLCTRGPGISCSSPGKIPGQLSLAPGMGPRGGFPRYDKVFEQSTNHLSESVAALIETSHKHRYRIATRVFNKSLASLQYSFRFITIVVVVVDTDRKTRAICCRRLCVDLSCTLCAKQKNTKQSDVLFVY